MIRRPPRSTLFPYTTLFRSDPKRANVEFDFAQANCDVCHLASGPGSVVAAHVALGAPITAPYAAGGPNNSNACLGCHPNGGRAAGGVLYSHAYFPIDSGSVHAMGTAAVHAAGQFQCASCHTALTSDPAKIDCTGCHTQSQMKSSAGLAFHAAVPDLTWPAPATPQETSLLCLKCHAGANVPAAVAYSTSSSKGKHDPTNAAIIFDVTTGSPHDTSRGPMPCLTCHSTMTTPFAAVPAVAVADFTQQWCTACHSPWGTLAQALDAIHVGGTTPAPGYQPLPVVVTAAYNKTCLPCHADGRVDLSTAAQNHVWFPLAGAYTHALGKSFILAGSTGPVVLQCATCHQDTANRQDVTCTTCHTSTGTNAAGPNAIDLAPAHAGRLAGTTWQAAPGPTPQCLLCHANDFLERVNVHGSGSPPLYPSDFPGTTFAIASGPHFADCETCHSSQVTAAGFKDPHIDFAERSCDSCHGEAKDRVVTNHAGIGIVIQDPAGPNNAGACLQCHPDGSRAPVTVSYSHPYFPVGGGSVHAMGAPAVHAAGQFQCASCHTALTSDPATIDCTGCHTQSQMKSSTGLAFHAAVPDLTWPSPATPQETSLLCLKCHADSNVPASVSYSTISSKGKHDPTNAAIVFDVTTRSPHDTSRVSMPCLTCHASAATPFAAVSSMAVADFTQQWCTTCHSPSGTLAQDLDAIHVGVTTPALEYQPLQSVATAAYNKTCLPCHADGRVDLTIAAQSHVWFPLSGADTHALGKSFILAGSTGPVVLQCATCHQDTANRQDVVCTTCHTSDGTNAAGPNAIDLAPAHAGRLAGTTWQAAPGPTPQCLLCHANDFLERVNVHGSGSPPLYPSDFPGTTFAIASGPHFAACETCHVSQATDTGFKDPHIDFAQRSCDSCHGEAKDRIVTNHVGIGIAIQDPTGPNNAGACLQCHPDGRSAPVTVSYSHPYFPVGAGSVHAMGTAAVHAAGQFQCASCHTALTSDPAKIDCTGCHTQSQMKSSAGLAFHAAVPDLTWPSPVAPQETSLLCLKCHADSNVPASVSYSTSSSKGKHDPTNAAIVFDVTTGSPHRSMPCLTCHSSMTTPFPAVPAMALADFTQQWCTTCHSPGGSLAQDLDAIHVGVTTPAPGYQPLPSVATAAYNKTCLPCHADGRVDLSTAAQNHVWFPLAGADTHALGRTFILAGSAGPVVLQCATCHQDTANRQDVVCTTCHTSDGTNAAGPNAIDLAPAHAARLAGTTWQAAPGPTPQCLLCHANDFLERVNVHGSGSPPLYPSDFPGTTFAITSGPHFTDCESCHGSKVTAAGFKDPHIDFAERSCDSCHGEAKDRIVTNHAGIGIAIQDPTDPSNA